MRAAEQQRKRISQYLRTPMPQQFGIVQRQHCFANQASLPNEWLKVVVRKWIECEHGKKIYYGTPWPLAATQRAYQSSRSSWMSAAFTQAATRSSLFVPMMGSEQDGCAMIQA